MGGKKKKERKMQNVSGQVMSEVVFLTRETKPLVGRNSRGKSFPSISVWKKEWS